MTYFRERQPLFEVVQGAVNHRLLLEQFVEKILNWLPEVIMRKVNIFTASRHELSVEWLSEPFNAMITIIDRQS